jgi:hypothetical protein
MLDDVRSLTSMATILPWIKIEAGHAVVSYNTKPGYLSIYDWDPVKYTVKYSSPIYVIPIAYIPQNYKPRHVVYESQNNFTIWPCLESAMRLFRVSNKYTFRGWPAGPTNTINVPNHVTSLEFQYFEGLPQDKTNVFAISANSKLQKLKIPWLEDIDGCLPGSLRDLHLRYPTQKNMHKLAHCMTTLKRLVLYIGPNIITSQHIDISGLVGLEYLHIMADRRFITPKLPPNIIELRTTSVTKSMLEHLPQLQRLHCDMYHGDDIFRVPSTITILNIAPVCLTQDMYLDISACVQLTHLRAGYHLYDTVPYKFRILDKIPNTVTHLCAYDPPNIPTSCVDITIKWPSKPDMITEEHTQLKTYKIQGYKGDAGIFTKLGIPPITNGSWLIANVPLSDKCWTTD